MNCSYNCSAHENDNRYDHNIRMVSSLIFSIECLLITSNVVSIVVYSRGRRSRTELSPLFVNLCISDMLTLVWLPMVIVTLINNEGLQTLPYCPIMYLSQTSSILTNLVISIQRYVAIKLPFHVRRSIYKKRTATIVIVILWIVAALSATSAWCFGICYEEATLSSDAFRNLIIFVFFTFMLPISLASVFYILTWQKLRKRTLFLSQTNSSMNNKAKVRFFKPYI